MPLSSFPRSSASATVEEAGPESGSGLYGSGGVALAGGKVTLHEAEER